MITSWLEEENGILRGYEFKWNENRKPKFLYEKLS
jgi:hypothetical protein